MEFENNFWGDQGYVVLDQFFSDRSTSSQNLIRFMSDLAKYEEQYANGLEKLIKRFGNQVSEIGTLEDTWKVLLNQLEKYAKMINDRSTKLQNDSNTLDQFDKENSRIVKKDLGEAKKLLNDYQAQHLQMTRSRGKYNKACQLGQELDKQIQVAKTQTSDKDKNNQLSKLEKDRQKTEKVAKQLNSAYKESVEKLTTYQPTWEKKLRNVYKELQAQEICRSESVIRCYKNFLDAYTPTEAFVEAMKKDITSSLGNINYDNDIAVWTDKHKTNTTPPPMPTYIPFDGEPEKPAAPKPASQIRASTNAAPVNPGLTRVPTTNAASVRPSVGASDANQPRTTPIRRQSTTKAPNLGPAAPTTFQRSTTRGGRPSGASPARPLSIPPQPPGPAPTPTLSSSHGVASNPASATPAPMSSSHGATPSFTMGGSRASVRMKPFAQSQLDSSEELTASTSSSSSSSSTQRKLPPGAVPMFGGGPIQLKKTTPNNQQQDRNSRMSSGSASSDGETSSASSSRTNSSRGFGASSSTSSSNLNERTSSSGKLTSMGSSGNTNHGGLGSSSSNQIKRSNSSPSGDLEDEDVLKKMMESFPSLGFDKEEMKRLSTANFGGKSATPNRRTQQPQHLDMGQVAENYEYDETAETYLNDPYYVYDESTGEYYYDYEAAGYIYDETTGEYYYPEPVETTDVTSGGYGGDYGLQNFGSVGDLDDLAIDEGSLMNELNELNDVGLSNDFNNNNYDDNKSTSYAADTIPQESSVDYINEQGISLETLGYVRAVYDYEGGEEDELNFPEGAIIRLLSKHESGWWTGEYNGKAGLFPGNHVEITNF
eukprot:TRINITY_DN5524_c0_g3_i1.p1 TRINITY_DN5524_c0_g3~~TRINITY_DN5524_c0_g3_i1.p1  ORF type:complete len:824 (+),score=268.23 TRINITY_DN5524_c0_g3_i1:378-2849(+)